MLEKSELKMESIPIKVYVFFIGKTLCFFAHFRISVAGRGGGRPSISRLFIAVPPL